MIFKDVVIYFGSSVLNKAVPLLLLPVITSYLPPADYGLLAIFMTLVAFFNAFIGMNMHINISRLFFKVERHEMAQYIGSILRILTVTLVIYLTILLVILCYTDSVFSISQKQLLLIPFISFFSMISTISTTVLRNEQRPYLFGFFELGNTVLKTVVTIILLVFLHYGWVSQVIGILLGNVVFSFVGLRYLCTHKYLTLRGTLRIGEILKTSIPLIPHVLGNIIIAMSDRLVIEKIVGVKEVGIYSVGYMLGSTVQLFIDAFIKAWSPWFFRILSRPSFKKKKKIVLCTYFYIVVIFLLAFLVSIVAKMVLPFMIGDEFWSAKKYIVWVSLGYAMQGVYKIFFPYLIYLDRTALLSISTSIAAFLNLFFNYVFVNKFGAIGATYATILAFGVSAIMVFLFQKKYYAMPWGLSDKGCNVEN